MITIDFYEKRYREINGNFQKESLRTLQHLLINVRPQAIEDALWDCNPVIYYSLELKEVKFEPKTLARLLTLIYEYDQSFITSQSEES